MQHTEHRLLSDGLWHAQVGGLSLNGLIVERDVIVCGVRGPP